MSKQVVVVPYDSHWASQFETLKQTLWSVVKDFAISIEHVGSTSIPGLAAKPILDIDIVIPDYSFLNETIAALRTLGYEHRGNLGIEDREAFKNLNATIKHNLYVCPKESVALKNHLCLRDTLRTNPQLREEYSSLKQMLAQKFPDSIDDYVEGKTDFILKILESNGLESDRLDSIRKMNLAPSKK